MLYRTVKVTFYQKLQIVDLFEYLQNVQPIVKSDRFLQIKTTYYNPVRKKKINIIVKDQYKLIPMPLRYVGECFELDVSKEVMPDSGGRVRQGAHPFPSKVSARGPYDGIWCYVILRNMM